MSQVSVSSIYTLCIFTTGWMIRMLASNEENVGAILRSHEVYQGWGTLLMQFLVFKEAVRATYLSDFTHSAGDPLKRKQIIRWSQRTWDLYCKSGERGKDQVNAHTQTASHQYVCIYYEFHYIYHSWCKVVGSLSWDPTEHKLVLDWEEMENICKSFKKSVCLRRKAYHSFLVASNAGTTFLRSVTLISCNETSSTTMNFIRSWKSKMWRNLHSQGLNVA